MSDNMDMQFVQGYNSTDYMGFEKKPTLSEGEEILDMGDDFDFGDFQVVRREFFAHLREPSITFNNCKIYVNAASLSKFPNIDFMQILINRKTKILALRPCKEGERDSFPWCYDSKGKRKAKQITCKLFFAKIFTMMEWNPDYRYKLLGTLIHSNGEYLLAFDLHPPRYIKKLTRRVKSQKHQGRRSFLRDGKINLVCRSMSIVSRCRSISLMVMPFMQLKIIL